MFFYKGFVDYVIYYCVKYVSLYIKNVIKLKNE